MREERWASLHLVIFMAVIASCGAAIMQATLTGVGPIVAPIIAA